MALSVKNRGKKASKGDRVSRRRNEVEDEIHRLECYIVEAPRMFREERLRKRNVIKAPSQLRNKSRAFRNLPVSRVRAAEMKKEKLKHLFVFLALAGILYFLATWVAVNFLNI